jgi:predicted site-specific integrase-resolvase
MAQLTTAEAAQLLGIAVATLNEWRGRNFGPAYTKTGRLVRYPDYEIERASGLFCGCVLFVTLSRAAFPCLREP